MAFFLANHCMYAQNVGIGATAPNMKLHVSSPDTTLLQLDNSTMLANKSSVGLYLKNGNWFTGALKTIGTGINSSRLGLFTYAALNQSGLIERMTILDNGNTGINNTSPQATLDIHGSLKISGANTNPTDGAVLTSDMYGNATWKRSKIACSVTGVEPTNMGLANSLVYHNRIHFLTESYDYGGSYVKKNIDSSGYGSYFLVPVSGVYHIDAAVSFVHSGPDWVRYILGIYLSQNSIPYPAVREVYNSIGPGYVASATINADVHLTAGQRICIAIAQSNSSNGTLALTSDYTYFNCHLLFPN